MARVYDEATILLLVFNHHKKHKTMFFFAEFALRECLVRNTEVSTFALGHQHGQIVLPWLVGTKHFPESKNTFQNPKTRSKIQKHVPESKNTFQNPKTRPRIQKHVPKSKNTFQNPKTRSKIQNSSSSGTCFWILGSVLDSVKCFVPTSHGKIDVI